MYVCEYICIHVYVCLGNATLDVLLIPQQSLIIHNRLFVFSCLCMYTIRTHSIRNRCKFTTHTWLPNLPHTRYWVSDHLNDLNSWDWDDELTEMTRCNCIQQQHSDNTIQIYNIETTILRSTTLRQQHWDLIASNEHIQICMAPCVMKRRSLPAFVQSRWPIEFVIFGRSTEWLGSYEFVMSRWQLEIWRWHVGFARLKWLVNWLCEISVPATSTWMYVM